MSEEKSPQAELPATETSEIIDPAFTRRSWLSLLALTGAGLFVGTQKSEAISGFFSSFAPSSASTLSDLSVPKDWMRGLGPHLPAYSTYLKNLKLRNISVLDVIAAHNKKRGTVHNVLPAKALWGNVRNTLKALDSLAARLDHPIGQIVSVYRSPAYNARCNGAKSNSFHLRNNAVDVKFDCSPGKVAAMARAMRSSGLFSGGVGRYPGFTHIDTRGKNADW